MKLIIDIPEDVFKRTVFYREFYDLNDCVTTVKALEKAVPLPKGHGDLIDRRELKKEVYTTTEWNGDIHRIIYEASIDDAPTIIEADKGEKNETDN